MKNKINVDNRRLGLIVLCGLGFIFLVTILIYLFHFRSLSSLEKKNIREKNSEIINYLNYLDVDAKDDEKYIVYALIYNKIELNKNRLTGEEIATFIKDNFNKEITKDDIKNVGITPYMLDNNVSYEPGNDTYSIVFNTVDASTISKKEIAYYKVKKMSKVNRKKYKVTYEKYVIENPYEVLNYYMEQNTQKKEQDLIDLSPIKSYLMGSGSLSSFKKVINEDDIKNFAKYDKKISIIFVVKDDELLIDKIK
ncbi:MAG: hypothetical protein IKN87_00705 [Bacilli bacterium]|nr:hypothetical protein [Bacilli bacterium]